MNRMAGWLFPAALGLSAAVHLLALFLWPYSAAQPPQEQPEPIPVQLLEAQRIPAPPRVAPAPQAMRPAPRLQPQSTPESVPEAVPPPEPQPEPASEPAPEPEAAALELAPPEPEFGPRGSGAEEPLTREYGPATASAVQPAETAKSGTDALTAEIAATQAVLARLRGRIVEKIRYPAIARANGWKGTVLLELLLDESGRLQGLAVRRSSGYAVLDRAASALMRSVTPVENPLGRPLRIEIPIAYELTD